MNQTEPLIRNVSDTARWVAVFRALETERPDALFRDPFARRLAGERGEQIVKHMPSGSQYAWSYTARTYLIDRFITEQLQQGVGMVVNLAAGLDTRPYRMALPSSLQWVEVDLPEILAYKEEVLAIEKPVCALERVRLDLSNVSARRELFEQLGRRASKALIISEGLVIYLSTDQVGQLAQDLAAPGSFERWILDLASPGLMRMLQKKFGSHLSQAAPFKFAPPEGPGFFTRYGWKPLEVRGVLKAAARLKRLSLGMRLLAMLPESAGKQGSRPWSGICLLGR